MFTYPEEYIDYLIHFHGSRDYFECHEIMEEYWLENDRHIKWLTLIQIAVAVYHERQKNFPGSLRLYRKVISRIRENPQMLDGLEIDQDELEKMTKDRIKTILEKRSYKPFNLPLTSKSLIDQCKKAAEVKGCQWLSDDSVETQDLVFRHKLRDRSDVIQAREEALLMKKQKREEL